MLQRARPAAPTTGSLRRRRPRSVVVLVLALTLLTAASALAGLLVGGGPGPHEVTSARGAGVTVYGHGLYAADSWLVGAGNRGQDLVLLLVELPVLTLALRRWWRGGPVDAAVLTGVLAFFAYYWTSMTLATAQNRLFPAYVAAFALSVFALAEVVRSIDVEAAAERLPDRPGRRALATYLLAVAAALTAAWLPGLLQTALDGKVAEAVGVYTSAATEVLDLGLVVPVAVMSAVLLLRGRPGGRVLTLVMLVLNACIGVLLMGQGVAQVVAGVPLTAAEIVAKMATFAALTLVAGSLLARMAGQARRVRV